MDKKDFLEFDSNSNIKILPMDFTSLYPSTMTFYLSKKNKRLDKIRKVKNGINTKGEI
jgi:hypothetical protein